MSNEVAPEPQTLPEFTALADTIERGEDHIVLPEVMIIEAEPAQSAPSVSPPSAAPAREHERPVAATEEDLPAPPPQVNMSMFNMVHRMKVGERLKLALRGNKEIRVILLRDSNKLIPRFVLKN